MNILQLTSPRSLSILTRDGRLLFTTRAFRLFAYGLLSVVLVLYLAQIGLDEGRIGLLLTLTLAGDAAVSLWITTHADRIGRRRMLMVGAGLMILSGLVFSITENFLVLTLAAVIGTISPSGNEVGPFLPIEQAGLTHTLPDDKRTHVFAWYNLTGSLATATGALVGGVLAGMLQTFGAAPVTSYRAIILLYTLLGILLAALFYQLSSAIEVSAPRDSQGRLGLTRSRGIILRLSVLFSLDALGGSLVVQSLMAYWFFVRFGVETATIGSIFFGANLLSGLSALAAAGIAKRIGLINTMVFTHIPSNVLLMLIPVMPSLPLAVLVLLARFSISQMDVPTRQSYVMAVVDPAERSAAAGVTGIARSVGAALGPMLSGAFLSLGLLSLPFFAAGTLKIVYDLALFRSFRRVKPPEEGSGSPG
ncbi:MAG: MFS transporter [Chloroflexi bacterium]|nr:MFS transporter [Chloroflexota bacterium]